MRQKLYVLLTMDVEPVKLDSNWTGPETATESEKCLLNYRHVAREYGFDVSLFVHSEAAALHRDILHDWQRENISLGLHIHSTKFHYPKYPLEFGAYSAEVQTEILEAGRDEWQEALNLP